MSLEKALQEPQEIQAIPAIPEIQEKAVVVVEVVLDIQEFLHLLLGRIQLIVVVLVDILLLAFLHYLLVLIVAPQQMCLVILEKGVGFFRRFQHVLRLHIMRKMLVVVDLAELEQQGLLEMLVLRGLLELLHLVFVKHFQVAQQEMLERQAQPETADLEEAVVVAGLQELKIPPSHQEELVETAEAQAVQAGPEFLVRLEQNQVVLAVAVLVLLMMDLLELLDAADLMCHLLEMEMVDLRLECVFLVLCTQVVEILAKVEVTAVDHQHVLLITDSVL